MRTIIYPKCTRQAVLLLLLSPLLIWCSKGFSAPATVSQPFTFQKLALIAVLEPTRLTIENRGGPLNFLGLAGYIAKTEIEDDRSHRLSACIRDQGINFGRDMTDALTEELKKAGYAVEIVNQVKRAYDDPDDIDYESIKTDADVIVSAKYDEAGMCSGHLSIDYIPRLSFEVEVISAGNRESIKSFSVNYGFDAEEDTAEDILSNPKYAYESFEKVLEKQKEIAECYRIGIHEIAAMVAKQLNQPEDQ